MRKFVEAEALSNLEVWEQAGELHRRAGEAGAGGISLLVVERGTPGFTVSRKLHKMGWRCSDTAELSFDGARVPATNLAAKRLGYT